jgi:SpoVK/Ycf46/Vps4 family AAA+-type ATPase
MARDVVDAAGEQFRASYRDRSTTDDGAESAQLGELRAATIDLASVVLPDPLRAQLREVLLTLSPDARALFESESFLRTFRTGRGVVLLFDGPPGTGKSMTAEAVAGELGRQLYVVTPERVLSKWHGQTERALARAFDEAEAMGAVLVLDEADSLLEARSDAIEWGGRTANNMVNVLLRRLEEGSGIAILITNRSSNLDPALERRLTGRITFPAPDAGQRCEILRRHIPEGIKLAPDVDLAELSRAHALTGGRLRNAVLTALRRAVMQDPAERTLSREHLEQGLREAASSSGARTIGFEPARPDRDDGRGRSR